MRFAKALKLWKIRLRKNVLQIQALKNYSVGTLFYKTVVVVILPSRQNYEKVKHTWHSCGDLEDLCMLQYRIEMNHITTERYLPKTAWLTRECVWAVYIEAGETPKA